MVAVLDQGEHDVVLRQAGGEVDGVLPRHVRVLHALQDADRAAGLDHAVEQQVTAPLLDQAAGDRVRLLAVLGRPLPGALRLDLPLDLRREALPHQGFGEIDRGRDQDQGGDPGRPRGGRPPRQLARQQQAIHPPMDEPITTCGPLRQASKTG